MLVGVQRLRSTVNLRDTMARAGVNAAALARCAECSAARVSRLLAGDEPLVRAALAARIERCLNVPEGDLFMPKDARVTNGARVTNEQEGNGTDRSGS